MSELTEQIGSTLGDLRREFDTIAHNLANVNTVGYKRRYNTFTKALRAEGVSTGEPVDEDQYVKPVFDFSQGTMTQTRRPLDIALASKGFFVIETPDGPLYTRNGMFHLDKDMQIVDTEGRIVAGESGPIVIPPTVSVLEIGVAKDGNVAAKGLPIGKFRLVDFPEDREKLVPVGRNCWKAPEDIKPEDAADVVVEQGFQESSNVQMVEELVDMMMVSKLYQANMQFVSVKRDAGKSLMTVAMG